MKFRLAGDEASGFSVAGWKLERVQVSCASFDTLGATNKTLSEQPSNAFRYDSTADHYVNNVSFVDKAVGTCWRIRVTLNDSPSSTSFESAVFKLQK